MCKQYGAAANHTVWDNVLNKCVCDSGYYWCDVDSACVSSCGSCGSLDQTAWVNGHWMCVGENAHGCALQGQVYCQDSSVATCINDCGDCDEWEGNYCKTFTCKSYTSEETIVIAKSEIIDTVERQCEIDPNQDLRRCTDCPEDCQDLLSLTYSHYGGINSNGMAYPSDVGFDNPGAVNNARNEFWGENAHLCEAKFTQARHGNAGKGECTFYWDAFDADWSDKRLCGDCDMMGNLDCNEGIKIYREICNLNHGAVGHIETKVDGSDQYGNTLGYVNHDYVCYPAQCFNSTEYQNWFIERATIFCEHGTLNTYGYDSQASITCSVKFVSASPVLVVVQAFIATAMALLL